MFIGHFGVGLGAKRLAPQVSLGTFFLAAQFLDLLWPTLLLLDIETVRVVPGATAVTPLVFEHYPVSHSLLAAAIWSALIAIGYRWARRDARGALVVGVLVMSHWLLDAVVHRPDLPLVPGSTLLVGLNLWSSRLATICLELPLFMFGICLYSRSTRAVNRAGHIGLWALVLLLLAIYAGNLFGPPPPNETAIAWAGEAQWLLVLWGYWLDRHRQTVAMSRPVLQAL